VAVGALFAAFYTAPMSSGVKASILLVEDHPVLAETVGEYLTARGYEVDYAADGLLAMHLAVTRPFDAIVLDIMLPGLDGFEVCQRLRRDARLTTPILVLTARDRLDDKLRGFDSGADDYLVKPFDLPELVARIEALLRRRRGLASVYTVGDLTLDLETHEVRRGGLEIRLSRTLFEMLRILMRESPKIVPRETLERELWGDDLPDSDTLRSHLYNLRRAVDKPFDTPLIETLAGRGYRIRAGVAAGAAD
jgi:DNA-binding response OmpR family regulator